MRIGSSPVYVDTSVLAKVYIREKDSDAIEKALVGRTDLMVSDLAVTEIVSALARRLRMKDIGRADAARTYGALLHDLEQGTYRKAAMTAETHRAAERLLMSVGSGTGLRASDALHLALASEHGARALFTRDDRMRTAAEAMGTFELP